MKSRILEILFGDAAIREYATITVNDEIREKVYLKIDSSIADISQNHWLLCLDPIVFGIWTENGKDIPPIDEKRGYKMYFTDSATNNNGNINAKAVADLTLDFFDRIDEKDGSLTLLKLRKCRIHHLNFIKTRLIFLKFYKKPQLSFAKLKSFVSAYSYPRRVRVISFKQGDYYNIFPMDLLGDIRQSNKYVFGLRHTNTTLSKIIETKKMVVSEVPFEYKDVIYKLGSHHSTSPPSVALLPFKVIASKKFGFYVPEWANSYKEIRILKTINLGSHMLLWGAVQHECALKISTGHLFHIHYLLYLYQKRKGTVYPAV
ncbi:MAG TPA: hypothetical protein VFE53_09130 [Mucilaginibacter sp.]|jgi:hypothetical protein|nr:hypothetical protein [Mucilaginibacter sp.]